MTRPFDLKAALSGEPVVMFDGCRDFIRRSVVWLSVQFPPKSEREGARIEFRCEGDAENYTRYMPLSGEWGIGNYRLEMAPRKVKKTVWVNLTEHRDGTRYWYAHPSEECARNSSCSEKPLATAVPVEIEVEE